jgi:hypothetical protein
MNKEITKPTNGPQAFTLRKRDIVFLGCGEHQSSLDVKALMVIGSLCPILVDGVLRGPKPSQLITYGH